ncbi:MAG: zinc metalloprotease HtpX [Candidatus Rehaiarchaeum fermentans]|nr:zinc metalloprotease HtpX [Candidatus Rehaiarchaeum fermentans]
MITSSFKLKLILGSFAVILIMFALVLAILYFVGLVNSPYLISLALSISLFILLVQWLLGPKMIESFYNLKEVTHDKNYYWLVNLVNEEARKDGINKIKIYIANVNELNAFSFGNVIFGNSIAITEPLLSYLNEKEIRAVVEHELGHLKHKDVELILAISIIPSLIYYLGLSLFFGDDREGNGALIGMLLLIFSSIFQIFILFVNRNRELYADYNSAIKGNGKYLETALAKIYSQFHPVKSNNISSMLMLAGNQRFKTSDYNNLIKEWRKKKVSIFEDLFLDHPHPARRIQFIDKVSGVQ